jgi:hypothetical protein
MRPTPSVCELARGDKCCVPAPFFLKFYQGKLRLMGTSTQTTNTNQSGTSSNTGTSTTAPGWTPQLSDLTTAFTDANGTLSQAQGVGTPTFSSADPYLTANSTIGSTGGALTTSGTNAATTGLSDLTNYNPSATNNANTVTNAAQQYVAGQNIPGEVQAGMQSADQTANQVTLPGITQAADMTGNADSSRSGIAQGMVQESLANQAAGLYSSDYNSAYQNGLSLAENQEQANNAGALTAAEGAASAGTSAAGEGTSQVGDAITNTGNANTIDQNNYTSLVSDPYAALANYMSLIGGTNWGSTTNSSSNGTTTGTGTSTTQSSPSALSMLTSLLGGVGGLAGGLGSLFGSGSSAGGTPGTSIGGAVGPTSFGGSAGPTPLV